MRRINLQHNNNNLAEDFWHNCHTFFKTIKQISQDVGLKSAEMQALMAIAHFHIEKDRIDEKNAVKKELISRPVSIKELVTALELSHPATSQKISALEEQGFIERTFDKNDKRIICVNLTKKGIDKVESTKKSIDNILKNALREFGSENTQQFIHLINEFCTVINRNKQSEGK